MTSASSRPAGPDAPAPAPVTKVVHLIARPESRAALAALLAAKQVAFRAEPGTRAWTVHRVRGSEDELVLLEVFEDDAAAADHDASPDVRQLLDALPGLLQRDPRVLLLDPLPR